MKKECESTGQMLTKKETMKTSTLHFGKKKMLDTRTTDGTELYFINHPAKSVFDDINSIHFYLIVDK